MAVGYNGERRGGLGRKEWDQKHVDPLLRDKVVMEGERKEMSGMRMNVIGRKEKNLVGEMEANR